MSTVLRFKNTSDPLLLGDRLELDVSSSLLSESLSVTSVDGTPLPKELWIKAGHIVPLKIGKFEIPALLFKQAEHEIGMTEKQVIEIVDPSSSEQLKKLSQNAESLEQTVGQRFVPVSKLYTISYVYVSGVSLGVLLWLVSQYYFYQRIKRKAPRDGET